MIKNKQIDNLDKLLENLTAPKKAVSPDAAFSTYLENSLKFEHAKIYGQKEKLRRLLPFFTFPRLALSSVFAIVVIGLIIFFSGFQSEKVYLQTAQKELDNVADEVSSIDDDLKEFDNMLADFDADYSVDIQNL